MEQEQMRRYQTLIRLFALPAAVALLKGCGDGDSPTRPPPPEPRRPTSVMVSPATIELTALGTTVQLTAEVRDQDDMVMSGVTVTWSSDDTSVASVDASGLVTAVANGQARITASRGSASGSAAVTVMQSVASVQVLPAAVELDALEATVQLTGEAMDANGHAIATTEFSWESSDVAIATVDASGLVTGVGEGTVTITASAGGRQGSAEITVMDLEREALIALYEATDGPNWVASENWLTDAPLGEWYGVETDGSGRVVALNLAGTADSWPYVTPHGLDGPIPPEIGHLARLRRLTLAYNHLTGPIPPEIGSLTSLRGLDLDNNALSGSIPAELGNLVELIELDLTENNLTGPVPAELGSLAKLETLFLSRNALTGPLPQSLLDLTKLRQFEIQRNASLCVPGISAFVAWLEAIEDRNREVSYCNAADVVVLTSLFEATGGTGWTSSDRWLDGFTVDEWHGVRADSLGRVTALDLSSNGLAGRLPGILGELAQMTELRITDNADLSGRLPLSLARLSLQVLHYSGTRLCAPAEPSFRDWLSAIPSHEGTGAECTWHIPIIVK